MTLNMETSMQISNMNSKKKKLSLYAAGDAKYSFQG